MSTTASIYRVSPEFIGSRNCVPMAFTAESPLAQGQYSPQGSSSNRCRLCITMDQLILYLFFPTPTIGIKYVQIQNITTTTAVLFYEHVFPLARIAALYK